MFGLGIPELIIILVIILIVLVNEVEIRILDSGIGIPKEEIPKIFDRFFQVDGSHTREQEGTGIGLALTKELVELHKGTIEVQSEEGKGTTFIVRIPLGKEHLIPEEIYEIDYEYEKEEKKEMRLELIEEVVPDSINKQRLEIESSEKPTFIVVEDNSDVRAYIKENLRDDYRVIEAVDGEDGWNKSIEQIPDLIVSDVMMPKMDGDAQMDEWGYVMATLPSNTNKNVVPIGFIAHVDTSPAVSGANVKTMIHKNYKGGDIKLPKDNQVIKAKDNPDLKNMKGYDIITSDGSTLLGADNKCGVAEIIDAVNYLIKHPEVKHGDIKICFTPDEEVGRGTEKFDLNKFGAKYAYPVDGQSRGEVETETFSADGVTVKFFGKNIHPGYAKGIMINSLKIAASFIESLPKKTLSPETTEKREGYVHPNSITGVKP